MASPCPDRSTSVHRLGRHRRGGHEAVSEHSLAVHPEAELLLGVIGDRTADGKSVVLADYGRQNLARGRGGIASDGPRSGPVAP